MAYEIGSTVFENWTVVRHIGKGSYGEVFEIQREQDGKTERSALKIVHIPFEETSYESMRSEGMSEQETRKYFEDLVEEMTHEIHIMSKLRDYSGIVQYQEHTIIHEGDEISWDILIRMELLTPFQRYALDKEMTAEDVVELGMQLSGALAHCHNNKIIHRDIKPENIFVNEQGMYKLGDFGVARALEQTILTMSRKGTMNYMAPEVNAGKGYGISADIYSLGLVLYRLANHNRLPFMPPAPQPIRAQDRMSAFALRISGETFPMPDGVDEELGKIILKASAFEIEDRYQKAEELNKALQNYYRRSKGILTDETDVADEKKPVVVKPVKKSPVKAIVGAAVGIVAAAVVGVGAFTVGGYVPVFGIDGMTADDAMTMLTGKGLTVQTEALPSETVERGNVIDLQYDGILPSKNKEVVLQVSSGREIEMPSVVNEDAETAKEKLENLGLTVTTEQAYSADMEAGRISAQDAEEGALLHSGDAVTLTVSLGKQEIKLESYRGKGVKHTTAALEELGLNVMVEQKDSPTVKKDRIITTRPKKGETVYTGDTVTLYQCTGEVTVPDVGGKSAEDAKSALEKAGLTVETSYQSSSTVANGKVISQHEDAGSRVEQGTTVTIIVSTGAPQTQSQTSQSNSSMSSYTGSSSTGSSSNGSSTGSTGSSNGSSSSSSGQRDGGGDPFPGY